TAMGDEAQQALYYFEREHNIKAYGTRRIVGLFDLDAHGVRTSRRNKLFADAQDKIQLKDAVDRSEILDAHGRSMKLSEVKHALDPYFDASRIKDANHVRIMNMIANFFYRKEWFELPGLLAVPERWQSMGRLLGAESPFEKLLDAQLVRATV